MTRAALSATLTGVSYGTAALFMAMALESWLVYFLGTSHHRHQQLKARCMSPYIL